MPTHLLASILLAFASVAAAADCGNCRGERVVGAGPVRYPCPVCEGTGESVVVHKPVIVSSAPAAARGGPRPAIVRITASRGRERHCGSGTLVRASGTTGLILTNWHVVEAGSDCVSVEWPDGTRSQARLVASDRTWDLAALEVPRPVIDPLPIAAAAPRIGETLTIAGYGSGAYREQAGAVTQYLSPARSNVRQFVEVRASARQGDSGGPMLTASGELAGVLFGCADGLTAGSCSTRVVSFLETVPGSDPPARSVCTDGRCER